MTRGTILKTVTAPISIGHQSRAGILPAWRARQREPNDRCAGWKLTPGVWTFEQRRAARGRRPHSYQPRETPCRTSRSEAMMVAVDFSQRMPSIALSRRGATVERRHLLALQPSLRDGGSSVWPRSVCSSPRPPSLSRRARPGEHVQTTGAVWKPALGWARSGSGPKHTRKIKSRRSLNLLVALVCCLAFSACHRKAPEPAPPSPATQSSVDGAAQVTDRSAEARPAESKDLRQTFAEAKQLATSGSYDEAAARLLKMRIEGAKFSDKDAAAYRDALQETYSRALEAAGKGDPKAKAALDLIRAARGR